jgi:hypothetical protein
VSDETVRRLKTSISEVFLSLGGLGGSATPASTTGSASGSLNWIINVLDAGRQS